MNDNFSFGSEIPNGRKIFGGGDRKTQPFKASRGISE
jgi:hypothetical protein